MNTWAMGVLDRAVRTGLQVLLAYLSAAQFLGDVDWVPALSATGLAVVLSLATSAAASPSWGESWAFQLAERAVKTFLQTVLSGAGAAVLFSDVDWRTVLSASLLAGVYSVVSSVATTRLGSGETVGQPDLSVPPSRSAHVRGA